MKRLFRRAEAPLPGLDVGALAPLVDMMTLLLVFLLRTYSTEAVPLPPEGPFELSGTASEDPRGGGVELLASPEAIWVDGNRLAATAYLQDEPVIRPVYDRLLTVRDKARIEVHADRTLPWKTLEKILHTARAAGFREISLVAANEASL